MFSSALFTLLLHGVLIAILVANLWWPFNYQKPEELPVNLIQVEAVSIGKYAALKEEKRKQEEAQKRQEVERKKAEEKKRKEVERKKVEEQKRQEAERKKVEEQKRQEVERKKAEEQKRQEAERKKVEEQKRKEAERKKAEEQKRKEAERKKAEEQKRKEAERKKAEEQRRIEAERKERQTRRQAVDAFLLIKAQVQQTIEDNWARPQGGPRGLKATIRVQFSPSGQVLDAKVVKSSNNPIFDQSAERAVRKASPLPFPTNPEYYRYLKQIDLVFNPDNV